MVVPDPGQWFGLGALLGAALGFLIGRWWYTPVDLRRFLPPAEKKKE